jgi:hypothetical protein
MATGIHNPFKDPVKKVKKPEFTPNFDSDDSERVAPPPPTIILDGESYGIEIVGVTTPFDAGKKLLEMLYSLDEHQKRKLRQQGVNVLPIGADVPDKLPLGQLMLVIGGKAIIVDVDPSYVNETPVYRRIAYAVLGLGINDTLKRHNMRVFTRR